MNEIANYHGINGIIENLWTPYSQGDTISVRLITDGGFTDYGFYIDYVLNGTTNTTYNWSGCSKVIQGWDFVNNDGNPMDDEGHGTHCAGIVAANSSIKGVAPDANIVVSKVLNQDGSGWMSDIIAGIEYCTNNAEIYNISVISMSIGTESYSNSNYCDYDFPSLANAITAAVGKNVSVIVASGNEYHYNSIAAPACIQNATPVGATEKNDNFAGYSNRNWMVQLFAPGSDINATKYPNGGYTLKSGTSMATPHVAGAFAIINQYLELSGQSKTPQEIESIFNGTGKQIYDTGKSNLNYSRINLYEALIELNGRSNITITSPEADYISTDDSVLINITTDENLSNVTLHIVDPSENISMDGSGKSWYYNLSGTGSITFFVTGKDVNEFPKESENRTIFLNNSAPNITQTSPATEINISEPNNQTFSINYTDDGPYTSVKWYLNSTLIANETAEWNFTGNYSSAGSYNITVIINDSVLQNEHSWILNINDTPTLSNLSKYPDNDSVVIDEPETTLFNISFTNLDDNALIIWYLNNTAQQAYENSTNYSFGGNYSCEGNYTIKVEINNSYDSVFDLWNLTVLNITQDLTPPNLTIESPENGTILTADSVLINVSSNETLYNSTLHIINTSQNISMEGSGQNWHYNLSGDEFITFYISANDSAGNTGYTENITVFLNNSAPNITNQSPSETVINISEPNNQTFTINYTDDGPYTSVKWYLNSSLIANETTEWNFTGNYSSAGSYNISIIINDSVLQNEHSWILNINNTNRPLYWMHSFINLTLDEDSSITYDVNATDDENDTITYSLNTTEISIDNDTGLINFTPAQDWYGLLPITVTANDGVNNITGEIVFNVTSINDAPQFNLTYNTTYNETDVINITIIDEYDVEGDNLTYGINETRFTLINNSFIWNTTYQDSGYYYFKINVSDGNQVTETIINITILDIEDVDNDGINDSADYLVGDAETITSNISLNISIGNLTNLSQEFNGTHEINISYNSSSLLEFNWTFSNTSMLNLSGMTIEKQPTGASSGYLLVKGLNLISQASTKTIYVAKLNTSIPSICIKDAEIDSINNISSLCNENDETAITCPGSSGVYNCNLSDDNHTFVITGLSHSGVRQQTYCGDGTKDADEECDGSDFGSETCITKGYDLGSLNCNSNCIISTTSCSNRYTGGGGGGGGGGSAAAATVSSGPKYSRYFSYFGEGVLEISIADQRIPLRNFKLRTTGPNNRVSFVFQRVDDISFIENPLRNAYHYMRIEGAGIDNATISSISFEFNINKSWFDSEYNKDKVYLERYYDNAWKKHTAKFLKAVNDTYLYKAETNGMSYFAITAEPIVIERPAPAVVEEEERVKEREPVVEKAEEVPSELPSEEIEEMPEVIEEEKGPGFFSRSWNKFSNFIVRNIIVVLLVIVALALLGGTGFNMYYYYISTLKQSEDGESEEDYEEEKKKNKVKDKAVGTAKKEHVNDWAKRHVEKGFSIDEIKGALVSRGFKDKDMDEIISSLEEEPGKNKLIKKIGNIKEKVKSLTRKFHK